MFRVCCIYVQTIIYSFLWYLHDCTFKSNISLEEYQFNFENASI